MADVKIRLGFGLGAWPFGERTAGRFFDFVDRCEEWGVDSLWFSDRIVGPGGTLEPVVTMAALSGRKGMMKFGTNALIMSVRHPVLMAKELATLDFLSEGRLLLVAGLGGEDPLEYEALGTSKPQRARRTDEALEAMRLLWTEDKASYEGRYYSFTDVTVTPRPVQQPGPPVWIGGRSDAAMRRTGRLGDGWLPSAITPDECAVGIAAINGYAAEAGREIPDDHFGVSITCAVADSLEEARELTASALPRRRDNVALEDYSAMGTPAQIVAKLREYVDAGVTKFVLRPPGPPDVWMRQSELLAREVIAPMQTPFSASEVRERMGAR